eukprot:TRINITY_DN1779_c0_g1_i1.p1 TRINITY_DN1779_c0_g1~~TRINITY_DN1779_c0_g1_i1.p1  ORF type:complete len:141 (-),score=34.73 TRINITY_DN1779_c0_g1_i1:39-461(-)
MADDEDNAPVEVEKGTSDAEFEKQLADRTAAVTKARNTSNTVAALKASLENPPLGCKKEEIRKKSAELVVNVLTSVKAADIKKHVDGLDDSQLDLLMKYIYRGFETSPADGGNLLTWHAAVLEKAGNGSIVRAIADRKTV